jgi:Divergent InlB B-repeat domain
MKLFTVKVLVLLTTLFTLTSFAWAADRFVDLKDGTMLDTVSHLRWLKNANCFGTKNWYDAGNSALGLKSDDCDLRDGSTSGEWELPNKDQLYSFKYTYEELNAAGFKQVMGDYYWSSTEYHEWVVIKAYSMMFQIVVPPYEMLMSEKCGVWPVRKGQWYNSVIAVAPANKDFGSVNTSTTSVKQTFTLSNNGTENLVLSSIALTGGDSGMFALNDDDGTCTNTTTIPPNGSCTVVATFVPTSGGAKSTILRISSETALVKTKDIPLSGTGVALLSVTLAGDGNGTVASPSAINCPGTCGGSFSNGETVTLTPKASPYSYFTGWTGACTGTGDCTVTMTESRNVTATFTSKLVSWWQAENNTLDSKGTNNGTNKTEYVSVDGTLEGYAATAQCPIGLSKVSYWAWYGNNCNSINPQNCTNAVTCSSVGTTCQVAFSNEICGGDPCVGKQKKGYFQLTCAQGSNGYAAGPVGQAFSSNGSNVNVQSVNVPHSASLDLAKGHTVSFWVKLNKYPDTGKNYYLVNKWKGVPKTSG